MISSEVQRTLVKSPPELWAELSDPTALARHLGELGEIRIVRTNPESTVEWTAENTTGTVSIKPSGWGTKVTLSVTRETPEQPPAAEARPEARPAVEPELAAEPAATDAEPEPEVAEPEPAEAEPESAAELEAGPATEPDVEPAPRRGFFARLFGRRRPPSPSVEAHVETPVETAAVELSADPPAPTAAAPGAPGQPDAFAAVRQVLVPETFAEDHPFAVVPAAKPVPARSAVEPSDAAEPGDLAAELLAAEDVAAEEVTAEEVTAVLTAVLDRLGAAHHRPFSRS